MIRLKYKRPFAWGSLLSFLRGRELPGIESIDETTYRRGDVVVRNDEDAGELIVEGDDGDRVRRVFDIDADPVAIAAHLGRDTKLARRIERLPGVRVPGAWDPFETSVRAIVGQQVSVAGATTIMARIIKRYGPTLTPERLMKARGTNIGMPGARWATIRALAAAEYRDALLSQTRPLDEALEALMSIKGIGPWTAHYIAMRALDHPDAFPAGDLGIRKAMNFNDNELRKRSEKWRPYRAYAAMLLWQA